MFALGPHMPNSPVLGAVSVNNLNNGGCSGGNLTNDTVRVSWSITGALNEFFDTKVYRSVSGGAFALRATIANSTIIHDETAPGSAAANGDFTPLTWQFRVDVVRKSDGIVVASQTSANFNESFGTDCSGGA